MNNQLQTQATVFCTHLMCRPKPRTGLDTVERETFLPPSGGNVLIFAFVQSLIWSLYWLSCLGSFYKSPFRNCVAIIQGESLARGPKLLSMYTVEQRGFLVRKYWQTGSFKACQTAFRTEFGERRAPSKCCIQKLDKMLETRGSRSNACRLLSLGRGGYWRAKCTKIHPAHSNNSKTLYGKWFKPSTSTLWEKYSRIWRNTFLCAWMWKETSFSIDYEQVLFCIVHGMCI